MVLSNKSYGLTPAPASQSSSPQSTHMVVEGPNVTSIYAKMFEMEQRLQLKIEAQDQIIRELRRDVEVKVENDLKKYDNVFPKVKEIEASLKSKVTSEEVDKKFEELNFALAKKADSSELRDRLQMTRVELQADIATKPSRDELKEHLKTKAVADEVEALFERQVQNLHALQQKVMDGLSSERREREEEVTRIHAAMTEVAQVVKGEIQDLLGGGSGGPEDGGLLGHFRTALEASMGHQTRALVSEEAKARSSAVSAALDTVKEMIQNQEKKTHGAITQEIRRAVQSGGQVSAGSHQHTGSEGGTALVAGPEDPNVYQHGMQVLRAAIEHMQEQMDTMLKTKPGMQEVGRQVEEMASEVLGEVLRETELRMAHYVPRSEMLEAINLKANVTDLQKVAESKAEYADIHSFMDRHKHAWQSLQERVEAGLAGESEARRRSDQQVKEQVVSELSSVRTEASQRLELELGQLKQELVAKHDATEEKVREAAEAAQAQQQAMAAKRQALKEEIAADFSERVTQEVRGALEGGRLSRMERQLQGVEESITLVQEANNSFKSHMYEALEQLTNDHHSQALTTRQELTLQLENAALQVVEESIGGLERQVSSQSAVVQAARQEMEDLGRTLEEGLLREQQARLAASDKLAREVAAHFDAVKKLEASSKAVIEAHSTTLMNPQSSPSHALHESVAAEMERRLSNEVEGMRRRNDMLRTKIEEGMQNEREARMQSIDLMKEEIQLHNQALIQAQGQRQKPVALDLLRKSIQNELNAQGGVFDLQNQFAERVAKEQAECMRAVKNLHEDVDQAMVKMQKNLVENTYSELRVQVKKEVDALQYSAIQRLGEEVQERVGREEARREEAMQILGAKMQQLKSQLAQQLKALQTQLASDSLANSQALQAAIKDISEGVGDKVTQANQLDDLRSELKSRLAAEEKLRGNAVQEIWKEVSTQAGRTEGLRGEMTAELENRWTSFREKQQSFRSQLAIKLQHTQDTVEELQRQILLGHQHHKSKAPSSMRPFGSMSENVHPDDNNPASRLITSVSAVRHGNIPGQHGTVLATLSDNILSPRKRDADLALHSLSAGVGGIGEDIFESPKKGKSIADVGTDAAYAAGYAAGYAYTS